MTKNLIKVLGLFLSLLMVAFLITSCEMDPKDPGQDLGTPAESTEEKPPVIKNQPDRLNIIKDGKSDYVIVRAVGAKDWEVELSMLFCDTVQKLTGVTIPIIDDFESEKTGEARTEKEIVIGSTNRENEFTVDYDRIGEGYHVFVSYERLVFASKSHTGLYFAIQKFFENTFSVNIETDTLKKLDYTDFSISAKYLSMDSFKSGSLPYMDVKFDTYSVSYATNDYMQKRMAVLISDTVKNTTGYAPKCVASDTPSATSFVLHNESTNGEAIGNGKWELDVSGTTINIRASDYYGFSGAAYYLKTSYKKGHYDFKDGFKASGDYYSSLNSLSASNAYAYRHVGDARVMFYNVLWYDSANGNSFPTEERNILQAQVVAQYLPDVIGFQEMDNRKRNGEGSLSSLIAPLGYVETIDFKVNNSMNTNYTPLFYNTNTTNLIKSEYYWYTAQDDNIANNDKSSKALTWGVFENKMTGDRYIVISTHMCTQDDTIRGRQAKEAIDLITELVATYHCPVFLGGDFNGRSDSSNYKGFVSYGYTDVQKDAVVSTNTNTHKAYPNYDSSLGMIRPNGNATSNPDSIDHIMMVNGENVVLNVFGVVVDECSLSASDHLPIFVDFSISSEGNAGAEWSGRY